MVSRVSFPRRASGLRGSANAAVRTAGRVLLWALIVVVFVRGVGAILAPADRSPDRSEHRSEWALGFPDGEARAFAVRFAAAYLRGDTAPLAEFVVDGLSDSAGLFGSRRGLGADVAWAVVAREVSLGESRALVTVAVGLEGGGSRYVTVPVARGGAGGLVVFEAPSFSPPPAQAKVTRDEPVPLSGPGAEAITDLAARFLRRYLSGAGESALAYFLAPGVRLASMPQGLEVMSIEGVDALAPPVGARRRVLASVRLRDEATDGVYGLAYRMKVVRRDRWYVAAVAGGPRS